MYILGLTGSIGMGKSTAAEDFRRLRIPVHDADATVHGLLGKGGAAVDRVDKAFPGVVQDGAVDRQKLGAKVFGDDRALKQLEDILHPLVREAENKFLNQNMVRKERLVVLDIPLLFETGGEGRCDGVAVVTAPAFLQRQRVMARPGMTDEKFQAILAKQMPDSTKRASADFIIQTGLGRRHSLNIIKAIVDHVA